MPELEEILEGINNFGYVGYEYGQSSIPNNDCTINVSLGPDFLDAVDNLNIINDTIFNSEYGDVICLPEGTYAIGGEINLYKSGVILKGTNNETRLWFYEYNTGQTNYNMLNPDQVYGYKDNIGPSGGIKIGNTLEEISTSNVLSIGTNGSFYLTGGAPLGLEGDIDVNDYVKIEVKIGENFITSYNMEEYADWYTKFLNDSESWNPGWKPFSIRKVVERNQNQISFDLPFTKPIDFTIFEDIRVTKINITENIGIQDLIISNAIYYDDAWRHRTGDTYEYGSVGNGQFLLKDKNLITVEACTNCFIDNINSDVIGTTFKEEIGFSEPGSEGATNCPVAPMPEGVSGSELASSPLAEAIGGEDAIDGLLILIRCAFGSWMTETIRSLNWQAKLSDTEQASNNCDGWKNSFDNLINYMELPHNNQNVTNEVRHITSNGIVVKHSKNITIQNTTLKLPINRAEKQGILFNIKESNEVLVQNCEGYRGRRNFAVGGWGTSNVVFNRIHSEGGWGFGMGIESLFSQMGVAGAVKEFPHLWYYNSALVNEHFGDAFTNPLFNPNPLTNSFEARWDMGQPENQNLIEVSGMVQSRKNSIGDVQFNPEEAYQWDTSARHLLWVHNDYNNNVEGGNVILYAMEAHGAKDIGKFYPYIYNKKYDENHEDYVGDTDGEICGEFTWYPNGMIPPRQEFRKKTSSGCKDTTSLPLFDPEDIAIGPGPNAHIPGNCAVHHDISCTDWPEEEEQCDYYCECDDGSGQINPNVYWCQFDIGSWTNSAAGCDCYCREDCQVVEYPHAGTHDCFQSGGCAGPTYNSVPQGCEVSCESFCKKHYGITNPSTPTAGQGKCKVVIRGIEENGEMIDWQMGTPVSEDGSAFCEGEFNPNPCNVDWEELMGAYEDYAGGFCSEGSELKKSTCQDLLTNCPGPNCSITDPNTGDVFTFPTYEDFMNGNVESNCSGQILGGSDGFVNWNFCWEHTVLHNCEWLSTPDCPEPPCFENEEGSIIPIESSCVVTETNLSCEDFGFITCNNAKCAIGECNEMGFGDFYAPFQSSQCNCQCCGEEELNNIPNYPPGSYELTEQQNYIYIADIGDNWAAYNNPDGTGGYGKYHAKRKKWIYRCPEPDINWDIYGIFDDIEGGTHAYWGSTTLPGGSSDNSPLDGQLYCDYLVVQYKNPDCDERLYYHNENQFWEDNNYNFGGGESSGNSCSSWDCESCPTIIFDSEAFFVDPSSRKMYVISKFTPAFVVFEIDNPRCDEDYIDPHFDEVFYDDSGKPFCRMRDNAQWVDGGWTAENLLGHYVATISGIPENEWTLPNQITAADINELGTEITIKTYGGVYIFDRKPDQTIGEALHMNTPRNVYYKPEQWGEAIALDKSKPLTASNVSSKYYSSGYFTLSEQGSLWQLGPIEPFLESLEAVGMEIATLPIFEQDADWWSRYANLELISLFFGYNGFSGTTKAMSDSLLITDSDIYDGWFSVNRESLFGGHGHSTANTVFWNVRGNPDVSDELDLWKDMAVPGISALASFQPNSHNDYYPYHNGGLIVGADNNINVFRDTHNFTEYYDFSTKYLGSFFNKSEYETIQDMYGFQTDIYTGETFEAADYINNIAWMATEIAKSLIRGIFDYSNSGLVGDMMGSGWLSAATKNIQDCCVDELGNNFWGYGCPNQETGLPCIGECNGKTSLILSAENMGYEPECEWFDVDNLIPIYNSFGHCFGVSNLTFGIPDIDVSINENRDITFTITVEDSAVDLGAYFWECGSNSTLDAGTQIPKITYINTLFAEYSGEVLTNYIPGDPQVSIDNGIDIWFDFDLFGDGVVGQIMDYIFDTFVDTSINFLDSTNQCLENPFEFLAETLCVATIIPWLFGNTDCHEWADNLIPDLNELMEEYDEDGLIDWCNKKTFEASIAGHLIPPIGETLTGALGAIFSDWRVLTLLQFGNLQGWNFTLGTDGSHYLTGNPDTLIDSGWSDIPNLYFHQNENAVPVDEIYGCTDSSACNYSSMAIYDDGSCWSGLGDCGDLNGDGLVNIFDVVLLIEYVIQGILPPGTDNQDGFDWDSYYDGNGDGIVNVIEIVQLINIILSPSSRGNGFSSKDSKLLVDRLQILMNDNTINEEQKMLLSSIIKEFSLKIKPKPIKVKPKPITDITREHGQCSDPFGGGYFECPIGYRCVNSKCVPLDKKKNIIK